MLWTDNGGRNAAEQCSSIQAGFDPTRQGGGDTVTRRRRPNACASCPLAAGQNEVQRRGWAGPRRGERREKARERGVDRPKCSAAVREHREQHFSNTITDQVAWSIGCDVAQCGLRAGGWLGDSAHGTTLFDSATATPRLTGARPLQRERAYDAARLSRPRERLHRRIDGRLPGCTTATRHLPQRHGGESDRLARK